MVASTTPPNESMMTDLIMQGTTQTHTSHSANEPSFHDVLSTSLVLQPLRKTNTFHHTTHEPPHDRIKGVARSSSFNLRHGSRSANSSPFLRASPGLKLPSFDQLGQFSFHLSRDDIPRSTKRPSSSLPDSHRQKPLPEQASAETNMVSSCRHNHPLTPPTDEHENYLWDPKAKIESSLFLSSQSNTESLATSASSQLTSHTAASSEKRTPLKDISNTAPSSTKKADSASTSTSTSSSQQESESPDSWLASGVASAVSNIHITAANEPVRLVSHTLPYPLRETVLASTGMVSGCDKTVSGVESQLQPGQTPFIILTHAVPAGFSISSVPASPAGTPNIHSPAGGGGSDDYFSMRVYTNASAASPYHDARGFINPSAPGSPMPIVPPSTAHIGVLERYIPPSSYQEYVDLFSLRGPSFLLDRLVELSPQDGSLLFIYPTLRGAETFRNKFLGPVLDPLLRHLISIHNLSSSFGESLSYLDALSYMDNFSRMRERLNRLCLSLASPPPQSLVAKTIGHGAAYNVVYADTAQVHLPREVWSEWFAGQEADRVKHALSKYWRRGERIPGGAGGGMGASMAGEKEVSISSLGQDVLDGIRKRGYMEGDEPGAEGVEVGVFVVRRSR